MLYSIIEIKGQPVHENEQLMPFKYQNFGNPILKQGRRPSPIPTTKRIYRPYQHNIIKTSTLVKRTDMRNEDAQGMVR